MIRLRVLSLINLVKRDVDSCQPYKADTSSIIACKDPFILKLLLEGYVYRYGYSRRLVIETKK